jgi:NAD(P)-dependent dehydrogenase (short-subunit alcohol dehydrogenase family)
VKAGWSAADIPEPTGRTAIVTGASGGIGYEIAATLAARGAHVVLASRSADRGIQAGVLIGQGAPGASTEARVLDLASLESVRRFAAWFSEQHGRLDVLVNNAGIAGGPRARSRPPLSTKWPRGDCGTSRPSSPASATTGSTGPPSWPAARPA